MRRRVSVGTCYGVCVSEASGKLRVSVMDSYSINLQEENLWLLFERIEIKAIPILAGMKVEC